MHFSRYLFVRCQRVLSAMPSLKSSPDNKTSESIIFQTAQIFNLSTGYDIVEVLYDKVQML